MELKTTQYTGGPTLLNIQLSYGELSFIREALSRTTDLPLNFMYDAEQKQLAESVTEGITAILQEASDTVKNFQA